MDLLCTFNFTSRSKGKLVLICMTEKGEKQVMEFHIMENFMRGKLSPVSLICTVFREFLEKKSKQASRAPLRPGRMLGSGRLAGAGKPRRAAPPWAPVNSLRVGTSTLFFVLWFIDKFCSLNSVYVWSLSQISNKAEIDAMKCRDGLVVNPSWIAEPSFNPESKGKASSKAATCKMKKWGLKWWKSSLLAFICLMWKHSYRR